MTRFPITSSGEKCSAIPETIVLTSKPVSTFNTKSLLAFGIFSASTMVPTRKSNLAKSSKVAVNFCGSVTWFSITFAFLVASSLSICFWISASSIWANKICPETSGSPIWCPALVKFQFSNSKFQLLTSMFNILVNFLEVKGKKGSHKVVKTEAICKATYICVCTLSGLVLTIFHGSSSAKYLFPKRATFINSPCASRNLYRSIELEITAG